MQKFILISFLFILSSFSIPKEKTSLVFKLGTEFIYDVDANSEKFELTIIMVKLKPDVVLAYAKNGAIKKKGAITISERDMDSARALNFDFGGGNSILHDETSIFLSRVIYGEVALAGMNENGTMFKPNTNEAIDAFTRGEPINSTVKVNGTDMQVDGEKFYDYVDEKHGNYHYVFTILKNETFPLIMDMHLTDLSTGWILHLKSINRTKLVTVEE